MNQIKSSIKVLAIILVMIVSVNKVQSQVSIGVPVPSGSAMLDVSSTTKGFLPPRMSEIQRVLILKPDAGLIVYQTDGKKGIYYYDGTSWTYVINQGNAITPNSLLVGGGSAPMTGIEPGVAGSVLMSNGTSWVSKQLNFSNNETVIAIGGGGIDSITSNGTVVKAPTPVYVTSEWLNVGGYAVYLKNKRMIYGNDFDGTAALTSNLVSAGITSSTTLAVGGASTLTGTLTVGGATRINNTLAVNDATTLSSTLLVVGASTLSGTVTSKVINNTGLILNRGILANIGFLYSTNATISSTLAVLGTSTLSGTLTTLNGINNLGTITSIGSLNNTGTITNTGSLINTGDLTVNGNGTITQNLAAQTLTVSGTTTLDNLEVTGTITGSITGNASTTTSLQTPRNINGVAFDGTGDITLTIDAGALTGTTLTETITGSYLTTVGTLTSLNVSGTTTLDNLEVTGTITGSITGNASTTTSLKTPRNINGVSFDGTGDITLTIDAGALTGTTLTETITGSYLTTVGTLTSLNVSGTTTSTGIDNTGTITNTGDLTVSGNTTLSGTITITGTLTVGGLVFPTAGENGQVLTISGTTLVYSNLSFPRQVTDQYSPNGGTYTITSCTDNQLLFDLNFTPSSNRVIMFINGVRIDNDAYSLAGKVVTYDPAKNDGHIILITDRVQFDYLTTDPE